MLEKAVTQGAAPPPERAADDRTLVALSEGHAIAQLLPVLTEEVAKAVAVVERRIFAAIADGKLTAEAAEAAWRDVYAWKTLLKRTETRVTLGQAAADRLAPMLNNI